MKHGTAELYRPRALSDQGVWDIDPLRLKVAYGIAAGGKETTDAVLTDARQRGNPAAEAAEGEGKAGRAL